MSERSDQILKISGLPDPSLAVLERGDALFVLTAATLLYHDESGTRRVTLRDLARIHSDQEGTLRVETPAGTALSASLVGFDPAEVQAFFRQVRDVTAQAKQAPAAPASGTPAPTPPAPVQATTPAQATSAPAPGPAPVLTKPADPVPAPAARPVVHLPERPQTVAGPAFPGTGAQGAATAGAPAASSPAPKTIGTPPPPRRQASGGPAGTTPPPVSGPSGQKQADPKPPVQKPPAQKPGSQKQAAPQPAPASGAPRGAAAPLTTLPVPSGPAPSPVVVAAAAPAEATQTVALSPVSAPLGDARADLLAQAGAVAGLGGRLRLLAVILMLAALGLAYFLFTAETPQPLNALWVVVAGGVGAVALTVLATLTRLFATLAQVVGSRGNGDG